MHTALFDKIISTTVFGKLILMHIQCFIHSTNANKRALIYSQVDEIVILIL